eukprot:490614-Amphidinium_carterae.1
MDNQSTATSFMQQNGWYPSKYNRRYTDYSVELINDPQQQQMLNISMFMQINGIWGSIKSSPFSPTPDVWLASHLIDYSIVSSSVHQYLNSLLELANHQQICNKMKYCVHNIFPSGVKALLMKPSGAWVSYKGINLNLQRSAHLASKFISKTEDSSSSE